VTISLPEEDSYSRTKGWLKDRISICYGGWLAESICYGETTTGAKQDLEQATDMARKMVCEWGMAEKLSPATYGQEDEPIFIGKEIARHKDYSETTAHEIDPAIREILDECRERGRSILTAHRDQLETLASELLEKETMTDSDIRTLLNIPEKENTTTEAGAAALQTS
jgi:cell division protease FtsH